ncbi:hypothetical protein [Streptomyces sp. NPDC046712]|uniref:hypothetical protein n=1 Tax=Streptomyces sp. NPDC046712 TaxID=3154802 RepID=UPI00340CFBB0
MLKDPAVAALDTLADDLVIGLGAQGLGEQYGVDLTQVGQQAAPSDTGRAIGGGGASDTMHLASAGPARPGIGKGVHVDQGGHLGERLPNAVRRMSADQRNTDGGIRSRMARLSPPEPGRS